jgi:hypothetical protein
MVGDDLYRKSKKKICVEVDPWSACRDMNCQKQAIVGDVLYKIRQKKGGLLSALF